MLGHLTGPDTGSPASRSPILASLAADPRPAAGKRATALSACMSDKTPTRSQLDRLWEAVGGLTTDVVQLKQRVAELEDQVSSLQSDLAAHSSADFEVVSSAAPSEATAPAAPSSLPASSQLSAERRAVARGIGVWLRRCLSGGVRGPSGRDNISLQSRYYLVVRDIHHTVYNPPRLFNNWGEAKPLCVIRGQPGRGPVWSSG